MASIREDPRYKTPVACISDHNGKQHQLRSGLDDPNEAAIAANVAELLAKNEPAVLEDMSLYSDVADLLTRLLQRLRPKSYASLSTLELLQVFHKQKGGVKSTTRTRGASITMFQDYFKERAQRPPHKFTEMEMEEWKKACIVGGYDPNTFMERLRFIREFFDDMIRYGVVTRNPCFGVKLTTTDRRINPLWTTEAFEDEDFAMLYRAAAKKGDYEIAGVLMASENAGCRPIEIAHLQWKHIFLKENCMRYVTSKANVPAEIFFTDQFYEYLTSIEGPHDPDSPVFPTYYPKAQGEHTLSGALVTLLEESGIDRMPMVHELEEGQVDIRRRKRTRYKKRPYSTRHTIFGKLSDKFGPEVVQKQLSQRDMRSTMRYAKPQRSTMKEVAKHLTGKVVGSVSFFKQEQEKQAAIEKARAFRQARRQGSETTIESDPVVRSALEAFVQTLVASGHLKLKRRNGTQKPVQVPVSMED